MAELTILERISMLAILPKEGDITTLRLVRQLREALSFSEEEHALLQFKSQPQGGIGWSAQGAATLGLKDIPIGEKAMDVVQASLKHLNDAKKLDLDSMALYERFVENPQVTPPRKEVING